MFTRFDSDSLGSVAEAVSIAGGWLIGWSGILLLLALL